MHLLWQAVEVVLDILSVGQIVQVAQAVDSQAAAALEAALEAVVVHNQPAVLEEFLLILIATVTKVRHYLAVTHFFAAIGVVLVAVAIGVVVAQQALTIIQAAVVVDQDTFILH
jgi:hypothetical protein